MNNKKKSKKQRRVNPLLINEIIPNCVHLKNAVAKKNNILNIVTIKIEIKYIFANNSSSV